MSINIIKVNIHLIFCDIDQFNIKDVVIIGDKISNKTIPKEILNMTCITSLFLPFFEASNFEFGNFINLRHIDLSYNNLTKLPNILLKENNIIVACLHSNKITNIDNISKNLKVLLITGNLIEYPNKIGYMRSIYNNPGIYTSCVSQNNIKMILKRCKGIINYGKK